VRVKEEVKSGKHLAQTRVGNVMRALRRRVFRLCYTSVIHLALWLPGIYGRYGPGKAVVTHKMVLEGAV
jgi:hypothetical protein